MSVFWFFGPFFDYFFYCPKFQKWNFIKNPWYTKIQHCTTLIFLEKLDFCDFFLRKFLLTVLPHFSSRIHPKFSIKSTFPYTPIYYIFIIRILCSFQQSNYKNFRIKIEKLMSVFWFFGPFFDYFFYCPKFQKWNFIENP